MEMKRTGIFENGLIWFGAAVSLAEILTGTYIAPLGFQKGLAAILVGHLIGCVLLYLAGIKAPDYHEAHNVLSPKYQERRPRILKNQADYDRLRSKK